MKKPLVRVVDPVVGSAWSSCLLVYETARGIIRYDITSCINLQHQGREKIHRRECFRTNINLDRWWVRNGLCNQHVHKIDMHYNMYLSETLVSDQKGDLEAAQVE